MYANGGGGVGSYHEKRIRNAKAKESFFFCSLFYSQKEDNGGYFAMDMTALWAAEVSISGYQDI